MATTYNYDALTKEITKQDVDAFRLQYTSKPIFRSPILLKALPLILILFGILTTVLSARLTTALHIPHLLVGLLVAAIVIALVAAGLIAHRKRLKNQTRMSMFAADNHFNYAPSTTVIEQSGMIFSQGHSKRLDDVFASTSENDFWFGNYFYSTGSGKNRQDYDWGVLAIKLGRNVPNMVLDSLGNNTSFFGVNITNLTTILNKNQKLSLEGDFDKYFRLYAPTSYERDALYIFTPDLMALLIDDTSQFDIEIVDNCMYVYSSDVFDMTNKATLSKLFSIVDVVGAKMIHQTSRYSDERSSQVVAGQIAEPGKRLKSGIPTLAIIIIVIVFCVSVLSGFF